MARAFSPKSFAIAVLRRASYRTRARGDVLRHARLRRGVYRCASCGGEFGRKLIAVDHCTPVVPVTGWDSFDGFIERLFCSSEGLQVLCKHPCHHEKTQEENALRRAARKAKTCKTQTK